MSRFVLTQQEILEILKSYGFVLKSQVGSHQTWSGVVTGQPKRVGIDANYKD